MHDKEKFIENSIKKMEKRNLTQEQQKELDAFKVVFNFFKNTKTQGLALTGEEEAVLDALVVIVIRMVKDSSVT